MRIACWLAWAALLLLLAASTPACAAHQPPISLTGQGRTLWYANEVVVGLNTVQHTAIELNKIPICEPTTLAPTLDSTAPVVGQTCHPLLSEANTRAVVEGMTDARAVLRKTPEGWAAIATAALDRLQTRLDNAGQVKLLPYLQAVRFIIQSFVPGP